MNIFKISYKAYLDIIQFNFSYLGFVSIVDIIPNSTEELYFLESNDSSIYSAVKKSNLFEKYLNGKEFSHFF